MGYDCDMRIDTGGKSLACVEDIGGMTYNVTPMFRLAIGGDGLYELEGKTGAEIVARLETAVAHIRAPENRAAYEALNPPNRWGSHEGATEYLAKILAACRAHPKAIFYIY
jgi:hypothetical protein